MSDGFDPTHVTESLACASALRRATTRVASVALMCTVLTSMLVACGNADSQDRPSTGVGLIIKTTTNPYFVEIQQGAQQRATADGLQLTVASGAQDGDVDKQIEAVNAAVGRGDRAIMITPSGPAVDGALKRARRAGIFVVALDTRPNDPDAADITFATDNFEAGRLIGAWSAEKMRGQPVVVAMLDLFVNRSVESDFNRDQGFLEGMGIPLADPTRNGDEAPAGSYRGGGYRIACHQATFGDRDGGDAAMRTCLQANPDINLVYTINEPAASGAIDALREAGNSATVVSVDGGCDPGMKLVEEGSLKATAQQYPGRMATEGMDAIAAYLKNGTRPIPSYGLDMITTGVTLVTDDPQTGVPSVTVAEALTTCWGAAN